MFMLGLTLFFALSLGARRIDAATNGSIAARYNAPNYVFNLTVHDHRAEYLRKRGYGPPTAQVDIMNVHNRVHLAKVLIGDKLFALNVDTSSRLTWVVAREYRCTDSSMVSKPQSDCQLGRPYEHTKSETYSKVKGSSWFVESRSSGTYVSGQLGIDDVGIWGLSEGPEHVVKHKIGIAVRGNWNGHSISSGTLGLHFGKLHRGPTRSILRTLFKEASVPPLFALALERTSSEPTPGGVLAFGGVPDVPTDKHWVTASVLSRSAVTNEGYADYANRGYLIKLSGFVISDPFGTHEAEGTPYHLRDGKNVAAIESNTPGLVIPVNIALIAASRFNPGAEYSKTHNIYTVDCNAQAPRFGFLIAGRTFYISEADLISPAPAELELGSNKCVLELHHSTQGDIVLGDVFLKNVLAVFDFTQTPFNGEDYMAYQGAKVHIAGREKY